jgi:hypothetical protein
MTDKMPPIEFKLGAKTYTAATEKRERMSMLIWGRSGSGKTTLAATAPKNILWINFDPDGTTALYPERGVQVLDFAAAPDRIVEDFISTRSGAIDKLHRLLVDRPDIQTVVVDSLTTFGDKALVHGVEKGLQTRKGKNEGITLEQPGYTGFGNKNVWVYQMTRAMLEMTSLLGRHVIFCAHESTPDKDDSGHVVGISMMLGSNLNEQIAVRISEIWHLTDTGKDRRIYVRPFALHKPMRTRMFKAVDRNMIQWKYDADIDEGDGINEWYEQWKDNGFAKIPLPK